MPITPVHCGVAYLIKRCNSRVCLPALLVSCMAPDLEIPIIYLMTRGHYHRLVLHSFLGATTLGTLLSLLLTVFVYAPLISIVFKVNIKKIREQCRFSSTLLASCFIGVLSHVIVDSLHHEFNPLLFPFITDSFDVLVLFNDWTFATVVVTLVLSGMLILFCINEIRKGTRNFWMRVLGG